MAVEKVKVVLKDRSCYKQQWEEIMAKMVGSVREKYT